MNNDLFNHGIGAGTTVSSVIEDFNITPYNNGNYLLSDKITGLSPLVGEGNNLYFVNDIAHQCNVSKLNVITKTKEWTTSLPASTTSGAKNIATDLIIVDGYLYVFAKEACYKISLDDGSMIEKISLSAIPSEVKNFIKPNDFTKARINDFIYERTSGTVITKKNLSGASIKTYTFVNYPCTTSNRTAHWNYAASEITKVENYLFVCVNASRVYWDTSYGQQSVNGVGRYIFKFDTDLNLLKQVKLPVSSKTVSVSTNSANMLTIYKKNILMTTTGYDGELQLFTVDRSGFPTFYNCDNEMIKGYNACILNNLYFAFIQTGTDSSGYSQYQIKGVNLK